VLATKVLATKVLATKVLATLATKVLATKVPLGRGRLRLCHPKLSQVGPELEGA